MLILFEQHLLAGWVERNRQYCLWKVQGVMDLLVVAGDEARCRCRNCRRRSAKQTQVNIEKHGYEVYPSQVGNIWKKKLMNVL